MRFRPYLPQPGFSLLEVMLVIVLIGIVATIIIGTVADSTDGAKCRACQHNRAELNAAIERYGIETGAYPASLDEVNVPDYFPSGIPACPVSGAAYTLNTSTYRIEGHTSNTVPGDH